MKIDGKTVLYIIVISLVLLLVLANLGVISLAFNNVMSNSEKDENMPEKCKVPASQDVNSWKEHLGHHAETSDCLKYF